jgi:hypothetical protein
MINACKQVAAQGTFCNCTWSGSTGTEAREGLLACSERVRRGREIILYKRYVEGTQRRV